MDPTIIVTNSSATDWTDVNTTTLVGVGTSTVSLRLVEKSGVFGTQVWLRKKGETSEITPYRLIDNGSLFVEVPVDSNYKFQFKTDGTISIYVTGYFTTAISITLSH